MNYVDMYKAYVLIFHCKQKLKPQETEDLLK